MVTAQRSEDYLKWIFILSRSQEVHGARLAEALGVSRPTVSVVLKELEQNGLILMDQARAISLTDKGESIARDIYERNRVFRGLLVTLGVDDKIAQMDACRLEHAVSPESFEAFKEVYSRCQGT